MDRWKTVEIEIEDFRGYLAPDFPPILVVEGYDFSWSQERYKKSRKERPYQRCGVYLFYDDAGTLLYVGKALWTFDKRIWTHQIDGARYIDLICFDERHAPFALALEEFLIRRLKPGVNTHGVGYDVPRQLRIPSVQQTHLAADNALASASKETEFGEMLMVSGRPREVWLSRRIGSALESMGFVIEVERRDGHGGRIDIAVLDASRTLTCAIEVKLYCCYDIPKKESKHAHIWNTYPDFMKRSRLGVPLQQIVLFGVFTEVSPDAVEKGIHSAKAAQASARRNAAERSAQFAADLDAEFGGCCSIYPSHAPDTPKVGRRASFDGTSMDLSVWVLGLNADVSLEELQKALRRRATDHWYRRSMEDLTRKGCFA